MMLVSVGYAQLPAKDGVISIIHKVNKHWQSSHPEHGRAFWDNAAYHTGNMEVYKLLGNQEYYDYSRHNE